MEKLVSLKRIGYPLIAVGLILLTFVGAAPMLRSPWVELLSFLLIGAGTLAVALYKCTQIIQHSRLRKRTARCRKCGWFGSGDVWYRYESCPECDSPQVVLH